MRPELVRVSKFLSLVLRHDPERIGIRLDAEGWVPVPELLAAMAAAGTPVEEAQLVEVVASNDKQRFALSEDGRCIRANQGHSIDVDLALGPQRPPEVLFHGTAARSVASILATGLEPGTRRFVHLSLDAQTARTVGARHGTPVVLRVDAAAACAAGQPFFLSANGVWLAAFVAPAFIHMEGSA